MTTNTKRLDPLRIMNPQCEIPINQMTLFMQNKPNLCRFWPVNSDYDGKQTQNKPNSKPIKPNTNPMQTQCKPNQTQINRQEFTTQNLTRKPLSLRRIGLGK